MPLIDLREQLIEQHNARHEVMFLWIDGTVGVKVAHGDIIRVYSSCVYSRWVVGCVPHWSLHRVTYSDFGQQNRHFRLPVARIRLVRGVGQIVFATQTLQQIQKETDFCGSRSIGSFLHLL